MSEAPSTVSAGTVPPSDPHEVMMTLVRTAAETLGADRCTLTSLDRHSFRVEASYDMAGESDITGREFALDYLPDQPLLRDAVASGHITTGGSLTAGGRFDPTLHDVLAPMQRTAVVPLPLGDTIGALLILSRRADKDFNESELQQLQQFAVPAVLALRNMRLVEEVQAAQRRGLETLTMISRHVASSDEPADFFARMSETVAALVNAERAAFWRISGESLAPQSGAHGFSPDVLSSARLPLPDPSSHTPLGQLLFEGAAIRYEAGHNPTHSELPKFLEVMRTRDMLAVPWRTAAGPIGLLAAYDSKDGFTDQDEWIVRLAARASALVWQGYEAQRRVRQLQTAERQRLESHADRMAQLEQQKTEFLQVASHELRTPITLVVGYLSMLEEGALGELAEPAQKVLPLMSARMRQMNMLVDRMLIASRLEQGSRGRGPRDADVGAVMREVLQALEGSPLHAERVVVRNQDTSHIAANPEDVRTVLSNLVSNALKYSAVDRPVTVTVTRRDDVVAIAVRDEGMGIEPAELAKLFRPFTRLEPARAAGIDGTGLGLYLARSIAMAQGGDIVAESTVGEGSTFTLTLPAPDAVNGHA